MNYVMTFIIATLLWGGFNDIATVNKLKKKAKTAYTSGDYAAAVKHYEFLTDSLRIDDDNVILNLANAYFKLQDTTKAVNAYSNLTASLDRFVSSVAHQQLGIIKNRKKQFEEALSHFRQSLRDNPGNTDSRYNYELLKKVLQEQDQDQQQNKDQQQDQDQQNQEEQQNQDQQQNKDQQGQDNKDKEGDQQEQENQQDQENKEGEQNKEGEKGEEEDGEKEGEGQQQEDEKQDKEKEEGQKEGEEGEKDEQEEQTAQESQNQENEQDQKGEQRPSFEDRLEEINISEEKAKMILEAMKNNEIQYFQNMKRKPTKRRNNSKPDW